MFSRELTEIRSKADRKQRENLVRYLAGLDRVRADEKIQREYDRIKTELTKLVKKNPRKSEYKVKLSKSLSESATLLDLLKEDGITNFVLDGRDIFSRDYYYSSDDESPSPALHFEGYSIIVRVPFDESS